MSHFDIFVGIDIGSVSVKVVLLSRDGELLAQTYDRHSGKPMDRAREALDRLFGGRGMDSAAGLGITGGGGKAFRETVGGVFVNEVVAQSVATRRLHPIVRTIIEIGGEDSKLIFLPPQGEKDLFTDFAMNTVCAAGTGSFLDQQASRLGMTVEALGKLAMESDSPPRVAGRCSVFAKSDMIHLQQKGTPTKDIVAGLCMALARNFKSTVGSARELDRPVSFQGGVAANPMIVRALKSVLGLADSDLIIPERFAMMGAMGAAFMAIEKSPGAWSLSALQTKTQDQRKSTRSVSPLKESTASQKDSRSKEAFPGADRIPGAKVRGYLGIDIGSISTCLALLDENLHLVAKRYIMTAGEPIEATKKGLREIAEEVAADIEVLGACTTGSARYLIADFVGADVVKNEITAQAKAAAAIDPSVDTIFEIGGQDSKYISLQNGIVVDFEMNKVCAAGTGSFLEEQAEKLGVAIKGEFGDLALSAKNPADLGERCTVFMDSELVRSQQIGVPMPDLVAGLCYSIVHNYLNKVVGTKRIGKRIFFQGGVANNKGVVAAFETVVGQPIIVPHHTEVTGAIGCALIALEHASPAGSRFKGFHVAEREYDKIVFECRDCPNHCEISRVVFAGEDPLFYGSRCEKYEKKKDGSPGPNLPDHFAARERLLFSRLEPKATGRRPTVGVPQALIFHELAPFWHAILTDLGATVIMSGRTTGQVIHRGVENATAETCFPVKIAMGHVLELLEKKPDFIFLPSVINMPKPDPEITDSFVCPYVQSIPYTLRASIDFEKAGVQILSPQVYLQLGRRRLLKSLWPLAEALGAKMKTLQEAVQHGMEEQEKFVREREKLGREVLASLAPDEKAIVVVSRPYNGCDPGASMEIPTKLRKIGIKAIPMDFLPVEGASVPEEWHNMYWRYGQKILAAAEMIAQDDRLFPLYLTNFACGPDSFLLRYFRRRLGDKPCLVIEVDEHSADAGMVTRCEAFLDSLQMNPQRHYAPGPSLRIVRFDKSVSERTLYLPNMSGHAHCLAAAFEWAGMKAVVLPQPDDEALDWGRKVTTGKECLPCAVTTGEMVKMLKTPSFDPSQSAFFMGGSGGPCRFGQYNALQRMVLDELGYQDVPIFAPNQASSFYNDLGLRGRDLVRQSWRSVLAADLLEKCVREIRPYEVKKGSADQAYQESLSELCQVLKQSADILPALGHMRERFAAIERQGMGEKPIIGIVGEFYIRLNPFTNQDLTRQIEALGGETWVAPAMEWFLYRNIRRSMRSWLAGDMKLWATNWVKDLVMKRDERSFSRVFEGLLNYAKEPPAEESLRLAAPYLHRSFEGEAVVTVGKSLEFLQQGLSGIVSVMPFTCMPGTISYIIMKKIREEQGRFPFLNMVYDGLWQPTADTRLEAFMHQARDRHAAALKAKKSAFVAVG